jgi:Glycosyl transferase family 2
MPKISVIMPVYNAGRFLRSALDSILDQSLRDFELICVDDGSSDGSVDLLASVARGDPRLLVLRQEHAGIVMALNAAFAVARAELIARMDSDDLATPERFARQAAFLDRHADIALVGSAYRIIDEHDRPQKTIHAPIEPEAVRLALANGNCIAHPTVMVRRAALKAVSGPAGPYRNAFRYAEDYDLWLRLSERAALANLPDVLLDYRRSFDAIRFEQLAQQVRSTLAARSLASARRAGMADEADAWPDVTPALLESLGVTPAEQRREISRMALTYARQARRAGRSDTASRYLEFAADLAPRGEGIRARLQYRLRRAKVWL